MFRWSIVGWDKRWGSVKLPSHITVCPYIKASCQTLRKSLSECTVEAFWWAISPALVALTAFYCKQQPQECIIHLLGKEALLTYSCVCVKVFKLQDHSLRGSLVSASPSLPFCFSPAVCSCEVLFFLSSGVTSPVTCIKLTVCISNGSKHECGWRADTDPMKCICQIAGDVV